MRATRRNGFTLIELMIVLAVTLILLGAVFTLNFRISGLWSGERARSELQQNFRFATDTITNTVRQATTILQPSAVPAGDSQGVNVMSDVLQFDYVPDLTYPTVGARVTYARSPASGPGPYYIEETVQALQRNGSAPTYSPWTEVGTAAVRPITEEINSLAAVHFISTGPKIVVILVAEYQLWGVKKTISYTTETYVRTETPRQIN